MERILLFFLAACSGLHIVWSAAILKPTLDPMLAKEEADEMRAFLDRVNKDFLALVINMADKIDATNVKDQTTPSTSSASDRSTSGVQALLQNLQERYETEPSKTAGKSALQDVADTSERPPDNRVPLTPAASSETVPTPSQSSSNMKDETSIEIQFGQDDRDFFNWRNSEKPICLERLYLPSKFTDIFSIRTNKDVVEYLIYRLCLPTVTAKDIQTISEIVQEMMSFGYSWSIANNRLPEKRPEIFTHIPHLVVTESRGVIPVTSRILIEQEESSSNTRSPLVAEPVTTPGELQETHSNQGDVDNQGIDANQREDDNKGIGGNQGNVDNQGIDANQREVDNKKGISANQENVADQSIDANQREDDKQGIDGDKKTLDRQGIDANQREVGKQGIDANQREVGKQGIDSNQREVGKQGIDTNQREVGKQGIDSNQREVGKQGIDSNQREFGKQGIDSNQREVGKQGIDGDQNNLDRQGIDANQREVGKQGIDGDQKNLDRQGIDSNQREVDKQGIDSNQREKGKQGTDPKQRDVDRQGIDPKHRDVARQGIDPNQREVIDENKGNVDNQGIDANRGSDAANGQTVQGDKDLTEQRIVWAKKLLEKLAHI